MQLDSEAHSFPCIYIFSDSPSLDLLVFLIPILSPFDFLAPCQVFASRGGARLAPLPAWPLLKDLRSLPAWPVPFPPNPNKTGMPREREGEGEAETQTERWRDRPRALRRNPGLPLSCCPRPRRSAASRNIRTTFFVCWFV